jgi:hypothetical protein
MPVPDYYSPELIRKAAEAIEAEQRNNRNFEDYARSGLFERAVDEGLLDEDAIDRASERYGEDVDYVDTRAELSVSDYPDEIPFRDLGVDPYYENYTGYRLASQDPKAREFFNNYLQNNPEASPELLDRVYQDIGTGALNREDLRALNAFESRLLNDEAPTLTEWEAANFIEREGTQGRSPGLDRSIWEGYTAAEEDLSRASSVADLRSNLQSDVRSVREGVARRRAEAGQSGLFAPEVLRVLDEIEAQLPPDEAPATRQEATDRRNSLYQLQRNLASIDTRGPYTRDLTSDFFASTVLPAVRDAIGTDAAAREARRAYLAAGDAERTAVAENPILAAQELARSANRAAQRIDRSELRGNIAAAMARPQQTPRREISVAPEFSMSTRSSQPPITGLQEELSRSFDEAKLAAGRESLDAFEATLQEYPELQALLTGERSEETPRRIRQEAFKPYMKFADTEQRVSTPTDRAQMYDDILKSYSDPELKGITQGLLSNVEKLYTSGDPQFQEQARAMLAEQKAGSRLSEIEQSAFRPQRPIVGGGGYVNTRNPYDVISNPQYAEEAKQLMDRINTRAERVNRSLQQVEQSLGRDFLMRRYPGLASPQADLPVGAAFNFNPDTREVTPAVVGDRSAYEVKVSPAQPYNFRVAGLEGLDRGDQISLNVLRFLAENPITGQGSVSFDTRQPGEAWAGYEAQADLPPEITRQFEQFVRNRAMADTRPGTLVSNSPISSGDLLNARLQAGETAETSSTVRKLQPFVERGQSMPNLRGSSYMSAGFGPVGQDRNQYGYVDAQGNIIPLQPTPPEAALKGTVAPRVEGSRVVQDVLPFSSAPRYYAADPVTAAARGALDIGGAIRRTPSSLLPGAADLIPSPEAIQTGYRQGPRAMGQQMLSEFVQGLPTSAVAASVLSQPAVSVVAPGVGAGLVGVAGTKALNEVVRQQTGEGIVPKLRQALGTAPRTGVADRPRPVNRSSQPARIIPTQQRNPAVRELQNRLGLAQSRFNPTRGEFGLSELLFGR